MHRTRTILASLGVVASALGAMGCSSSSSPAPAGGSSSSGGSSGGSGSVVSFQADIVPIFQQSCELSSSCHGQPNNSAEENLFLGDLTGEDAGVVSQVYTGLVNVKSLEDPTMNLVTPGSPSTSWLSHKMAGDQATFASDCATGMCNNGATCTAATPCGTSMPYGNSLLPDDAATINAWITQGALNN
jgi:hypothetical protein